MVFTLGCAACFAVVGVVLSPFAAASFATPIAAALVGAALGYLLGARRSQRRTPQSTRGEIGDAQAGERANALERSRELLQQRASALLGFSHDLRGPLQVVQFGAAVMRRRCSGDAYLVGVVADMDQALDQMRRLLADLVETAISQRATLPIMSERLGIPDLTERLRRRLHALLHGRDIGTTVLVTTNAPSSIEIDPHLLDRIVDNLLTNAAKYTERGTIVVELDGAAEFLVLKVSDTGCGIDPEAIGRIFEPGGSPIDARRGDSFGVGLSVVIRLLEQIGGHLEVMSKPGEGTTFWIFLPLRAHIDDAPSGLRRRSSGAVPVTPVVRVRSRSA